MLSSEFRLFSEAYRSKVLDALAQKLGARAPIKINVPAFSNVQPEYGNRKSQLQQLLKYSEETSAVVRQ